MADWPENWWDLPMVAVDVETTGLSAEDDKIIEVALVHMRGGEVEDTYCKLVQPGRPIGPDSERITGITDADLKDAPRFEDIAHEVAAMLENRAVLAYNLSFDRGFLEKGLNDNDLRWPETAPMLDPLILARGLFPDQRGFKLGLIAKRVGVSLEEAHRASHDAEAAGRVLYAMADLLPASLSELLELQSEWATTFSRASAGWRGGGARRPRELDLERNPGFRGRFIPNGSSLSVQPRSRPGSPALHLPKAPDKRRHTPISSPLSVAAGVDNRCIEP